MSTKGTNNDEAKVIRILALHGKGGDGKSFESSLEPLSSSLKAQKKMNNIKFEWDYLTAPFALSTGKAWWTLPPNTRSFNAKEYIGYDCSKKIVIDSILSKEYHIVLGHSQGAILLSSIVSTSPRILLDDSDNDARPKTPRGYIFNGAAWPNPFTTELESLSSQFLTSSSTSVKKALFVIGKRDKINPPEGAERVLQSLQKLSAIDVHTCYHEGGHSVPTQNEEAVSEIVSWILRLVQDEH